MKCPLIIAGSKTRAVTSNDPSNDCLKEECGWWVEANESCAAVAISLIIGFVGSELKGIREKMPVGEDQ